MSNPTYMLRRSIVLSAAAYALNVRALYLGSTARKRSLEDRGHETHTNNILDVLRFVRCDVYP